MGPDRSHFLPEGQQKDWIQTHHGLAPESYPGPSLLPTPASPEAESGPQTQGSAQAAGGAGQDGLTFPSGGRGAKGCSPGEPCGLLVLFSYKGRSEKKSS